MLRTAGRLLVSGTDARFGAKARQAMVTGVERAVTTTSLDPKGCNPNSVAVKPPSFNIRDRSTFGAFSEVTFRKILRELNKIRKPEVPVITAETKAVQIFRSDWQERQDGSFLVASHRGLMELVKDDKLAVGSFLDRSLSKAFHDSWMPLVEREKEMEIVNEFIRRTFTKLEKTSLMALSSARGSGKTQLLKACLCTSAFEEICVGAVMVIECSMPMAPFTTIMNDTCSLSRTTPLTEESINAIGAALIRAHVKHHPAFGGEGD